MSFLAILLALAAERLLPQGSALGEARLLPRMLQWLQRRPLADGPALPWLITVGGSALTALAEQQLHGIVASVLFATLVLFLCLGPRDLGEAVRRLIDARARGDTAEAERLSRLLQSGPSPDESHRSLIGALFIQSHERWFGVLLWFIALGPAAAVAYRLASRLPSLLEAQGYRQPAQQAAEQLHGLLAWIPVRITAALLALAGSMDDALEAWKRTGELHYSEPWRSHSWAVLAEVSTGALAMEEANGGTSVAPNLAAALREVLRMQTRALLILLAGFAVYTSGTLV